jgi:hypothetical protein
MTTGVLDQTRMRRRPFLAAIALPVLFAVAPASAQELAAGTLEQVNVAESTVVVRTDASATRSGRITPQTQVSIDGIPGDVRDLRPGQRVELRFAVTRAGAARPELVRIDVLTRPRPPG